MQIKFIEKINKIGDFLQIKILYQKNIFIKNLKTT